MVVVVGKISVILFVAKLMEKFGIRKINILSILILNLCCLLRCKISESFNYVLISMFISGMAGVFLTS